MNYRFFLLFLTFLICLVLSVVVNVIYGIDIVYTHLFYIPIILTGIWYPRYAVFLAATLGLIHIACEYSSAEAFKIGSLLRAAMFMVVAYVTGYLALRRDRLLNSLRESEELYKTLAEKSMAGVYVVQDGKFRFINSNAASYAGYTREELLDQEAGLLVSPEDREKVRQNAKAMLLGEMSSPYEFRIIMKEGETRWIMETVTIILHEGRQAILGNSMDITERRWAEEARYHNERLQGVLEMP